MIKEGKEAQTGRNDFSLSCIVVAGWSCGSVLVRMTFPHLTGCHAVDTAVYPNIKTHPTSKEFKCQHYFTLVPRHDGMATNHHHHHHHKGCTSHQA